MHYGWPVVMDGGGRPRTTEHLQTHLRRLQRRSSRTAPAGGAMPAWALEVRPGSPPELRRPWPAPAHVAREVVRAAEALGVPIAPWPMLGAHPLILVLNWPTDDIDAGRAQKLAAVMVSEPDPKTSPGAPPSPSHPIAGDKRALGAATAVRVAAAGPRPPSYAPSAATTAYSHATASNPLRGVRPAATALPVSSGSRVGFG